MPTCVRPSGRYYDEIISKDKEILNTEPNFATPVYLKDGEGAEKVCQSLCNKAIV